MHTTTQLARDAMGEVGSSANRKHAELFERVMTRIHRYFRRVIFTPEDADDCLQQTLVLLQESLQKGKYDPDRSFNTWLWLKARTVFAQYCRKRSNRRSFAHEDVAIMPKDGGDASESASAVDDRVDAQAILERVRATLSEETYEVFILYYEGGLTHQEICDVVGRDRKTVRKRIADAHRVIEKILAERSVGLGRAEAT